jgi:hypothetical protein
LAGGAAPDPVLLDPGIGITDAVKAWSDEGNKAHSLDDESLKKNV